MAERYAVCIPEEDIRVMSLSPQTSPGVVIGRSVM